MLLHTTQACPAAGASHAAGFYTLPGRLVRVPVTDLQRKPKNHMKKCKCCVNLGKVTLCNAHASVYLGKPRAKALPRNGGKVQVSRRVG